MEVHIGTSGYSYKCWGPISPDIQNMYTTKTSLSQLRQYASRLSSIEVNCTRYKRLTPETCKKWLTVVPKNFTFTIKAPLYITHAKKLNDFEEWWMEFLPNIKILGSQFTCLLFQFPPMFNASEANIDKLCEIARIVSSDIDMAFEFRHLSWYMINHRVEKLFSLPNWAFVILHLPETRGFQANFGDLPGGMYYSPYKTKFTYVRFHGTIDYSNGTYSDEYLGQVARASTKQKQLYYFNNVDTWTNGVIEGSYYHFILRGVILPSAIHNAVRLKLALEYDRDEKGCVLLEFE